MPVIRRCSGRCAERQDGLSELHAAQLVAGGGGGLQLEAVLVEDPSSCNVCGGGGGSIQWLPTSGGVVGGYRGGPNRMNLKKVWRFKTPRRELEM